MSSIDMGTAWTGAAGAAHPFSIRHVEFEIPRKYLETDVPQTVRERGVLSL